MSGNISHFNQLKMKDPITAIMAESEDNDDSMSLSCDLVMTYPGHSHDTYIIAAALLVVSAKCNEQPHDLIATLSASEVGPSAGHNKGDGSFPQRKKISIILLTPC